MKPHSMRIQYISDIHLEFLSKLLKEKRFHPIADVLCLAGDIGYPKSPIYKQFLTTVNNQYKKVFLITGNHEYYRSGTSMDDVHTTIQNILKSNNLQNISFLDNSYIDYSGVRFAGTTLWSKIPYIPSVQINDFHEIQDMTPTYYNELHRVACEFLESDDVTQSPLPVVVLSHHLPSYEFIDPKYAKYEKYNMYFASDCTRFFKPPIKAWICGHTHSGFDKTLHDIQFVCNPVGYPRENESQLDFNKVIELH
jgi:predicted MPP superfamily phosphohydrolase